MANPVMTPDTKIRKATATLSISTLQNESKYWHFGGSGRQVCSSRVMIPDSRNFRNLHKIQYFLFTKQLHSWYVYVFSISVHCIFATVIQIFIKFFIKIFQQSYCTDKTHCVILILFRRCRTGLSFVTLRIQRRFNWRINFMPRELIVCLLPLLFRSNNCTNPCNKRNSLIQSLLLAD